MFNALSSTPHFPGAAGTLFPLWRYLGVGNQEHGDHDDHEHPTNCEASSAHAGQDEATQAALMTVEDGDTDWYPELHFEMPHQAPQQADLHYADCGAATA